MVELLIIRKNSGSDVAHYPPLGYDVHLYDGEKKLSIGLIAKN